MPTLLKTLYIAMAGFRQRHLWPMHLAFLLYAAKYLSVEASGIITIPQLKSTLIEYEDCLTSIFLYDSDYNGFDLGEGGGTGDACGALR
jgi:hypothetical protein